MEPIQLIPHPVMDCVRFIQNMAFHKKMPLYYLLVGRRMESVLGVHEYRMRMPVRYHYAILLRIQISTGTKMEK